MIFFLKIAIHDSIEALPWIPFDAMAVSMMVAEYIELFLSDEMRVIRILLFVLFAIITAIRVFEKLFGVESGKL